MATRKRSTAASRKVGSSKKKRSAQPVKANSKRKSSKKKSVLGTKSSTRVKKTTSREKKSKQGQEYERTVQSRPGQVNPPSTVHQFAKDHEKAKNRKRLQDARVVRQRGERQTSHYEAAVGYFNLRKFARAQLRFEKVADGPDATLRHRAKVYLEICRAQVATDKLDLEGVDDYYNYAITLMNDRRFDEASDHLHEALRMDPKADYVHYAIAVLHAIRGNNTASHHSLKQAVELNPKIRSLALNDSDLAAVREDPLISEILSLQASSSD